MKYYSLNLKGNKKIEISEIISKDQLDSLINVLKEQLNSRIKDFYVKGKHSQKELEKKFTTIFPRYKYYFKNNQIIVFIIHSQMIVMAAIKLSFNSPYMKTQKMNINQTKTFTLSLNLNT